MVPVNVLMENRRGLDKRTGPAFFFFLASTKLLSTSACLGMSFATGFGLGVENIGPCLRGDMQFRIPFQNLWVLAPQFWGALRRRSFRLCFHSLLFFFSVGCVPWSFSMTRGEERRGGGGGKRRRREEEEGEEVVLVFGRRTLKRSHSLVRGWYGFSSPQEVETLVARMMWIYCVETVLARIVRVKY